MATSKKPSAGALLKTIQACVVNGQRLLEETYDLEFRKPPSSRFFLIMIAQEEFAKAFILFLVKEGIVLWSLPVLRAINDHACKQLVGMIMDYMIMHWDDIEELTVAIDNDHDLGDSLPNDIGSAMELLRYEKIGRWVADNWVWAEDPKYDTSALRIAEGKKDRRKQDALYVRIGRDGKVCSTPQTISEDETRDEFERARRFGDFVDSVLGEQATWHRYDSVLGKRYPRRYASHRYDKAMAALRILFE